MSLLDYGGISGPRLETLEERLRDDVIGELNKFGGRYAEHHRFICFLSNFSQIDYCFTQKQRMEL